MSTVSRHPPRSSNSPAVSSFENISINKTQPSVVATVVMQIFNIYIYIYGIENLDHHDFQAMESDIFLFNLLKPSLTDRTERSGAGVVHVVPSVQGVEGAVLHTEVIVRLSWPPPQL